MRLTQREKSEFPKKTFLTAVWFVVFGIIALIWHETNEENSSLGILSIFDKTTPSSGPSFIPEFQQQWPPIESNADENQGDSFNINNILDKAPRTPHQAIENLQTASMCNFFEKLKNMETSENDSAIHVLHYGDSILTTDELSGAARRILQHRFGDGGHGFVLLGKPWRWYHHVDVRHGANGNWFPRPLTSAPVRDGMFGLGGVAFETNSPNAKAWVGTVPDGPIGTKVASFDLSYLAQPKGGDFDLILNGDVIETVKTSSLTKATIHKKISVPLGPAKLEIRTRGNGHVRIFGAVLESGQKGLVYDSLAISGARASNLNRFDKEHWASELSLRQANLVILMFGANEGHIDFLPLEEYRKGLSSVIDAIRDSVPNSACLVMGPLDQAQPGKNGKLKSRKMPFKLSEAQREISLSHGCAFFDTIAAMGGEDSMAKWYKIGLGGGDLIHPTESGARQIGSWLADAILAGYDNYLTNGEKCASSVTSL